MYFQYDSRYMLLQFFKKKEKVDLTKAKSYYNIWSCIYNNKPKCLLITKWDDDYVYGVEMNKIKLEEIDKIFYEILKNIDECEYDIFKEGIDKKTAPLIEALAYKNTSKYKKSMFDAAFYISMDEAFNMCALLKAK